jgi:hypothetical protein
LVLAADLAEPAACAEIQEVNERLDVGLVVRAAGFGNTSTFLETPLALELQLLDVTAVARLAHTFAGRLAARGAGGIVVFESIVGLRAFPARLITPRPRLTYRASPKGCTTNSSPTVSTCLPSCPAQSALRAGSQRAGDALAEPFEGGQLEFQSVDDALDLFGAAHQVGVPNLL